MYARIDRTTRVVLEVRHEPFQLMTGGPDAQLRLPDDTKVEAGWSWSGTGDVCCAPPWATTEQISQNNAAALVRRQAAALRAKGDEVGALKLLLSKGLMP